MIHSSLFVQIAKMKSLKSNFMKPGHKTQFIDVFLYCKLNSIAKCKINLSCSSSLIRQTPVENIKIKYHIS